MKNKTPNNTRRFCFAYNE